MRLHRHDLAVMEEEGLAYGQDLEEELFPGAGGSRWNGIVALIYDRPTLQTPVRDGLLETCWGLIPRRSARSPAFYSGRSRSAHPRARDRGPPRPARHRASKRPRASPSSGCTATRDPRLDLLERFAEANDLVEENVAGALNSNLAFYRGMSEGGAFTGSEMTEEEMLSEVWSQEAEMRAETEGWLYPVPDAGLRAADRRRDAGLHRLLAFRRRGRP